MFKGCRGQGQHLGAPHVLDTIHGRAQVDKLCLVSLAGHRFRWFFVGQCLKDLLIQMLPIACGGSLTVAHFGLWSCNSRRHLSWQLAVEGLCWVSLLHVAVDSHWWLLDSCCFLFIGGTIHDNLYSSMLPHVKEEHSLLFVANMR